jgi:hypothetical protein
VIAVHQRSLNDIDDPSAGARVREKRHQQALRLSQYIQSLQAADAALRLVVTGDFNAFQFSDGYVDVMGQLTGIPDPAGALVPATDEINPDLTNQVETLPLFPNPQRYSFVFEGNAQVARPHADLAGVPAVPARVQFSRATRTLPKATAPSASTEADPTTALRSVRPRRASAVRDERP